ncbi:hypothetical protein RHMOL_Rhmol05G0020700 [Rhododendron molle]|uniref:Uncharacterized protein n=1 Tax=Rhododendron molle TaxID=49168 RepID=A0ACC0NKI1_RHOML|nr:hypothetical protein RHMOL_Rhmol05G0020700 [Rhododendron molle]
MDSSSSTSTNADSLPRYMNDVFLSWLLGGILNFSVVFIELFFILTSIWFNQFNYIFDRGFLFVYMA